MAAAVQVVGGVDHADTIHVAVLTAVGKVVGDAEFPTTATGYAQAIEFLTGQGVVERVGVEGAACYGRDHPGPDRRRDRGGRGGTARPIIAAANGRSRTGSTPTMPRGRCWPSGPARSRTRPWRGCGR